MKKVFYLLITLMCLGCSFCQCVLDKLMSKYSGPFDDLNGWMNDAYLFGIDCAY